MINKKNISTIIILILFVFPSHSELIEYTIKKNDTLYSLSRQFHVSIDKIKEINGIVSAENLKIGIKLKIPSNSFDFNENSGYTDNADYYVKKGDTLYSISQRNGISVPDILEINGLSDNHVLLEGERLILKRDKNNDRIDNSVAYVEVETDKSLIWPINGTRYKMNGRLKGIRISADAYSYVRSVATGKVVYTEPYRGFGNVILIDVNGYIYLYGGNEDIFVNVGEEVAAGTRIGRLGVSELSDGKKDMFFAVFKDGKPIDTSTAPRS
ncbi:MAG: LysM peptidoglycan-binding domain-containing protein [bacterium]|nr:LysM peptidoglycan-binding domain-containing protein [bacterium]